MLIISFLEKGLGIVSPPHSVYDFQRKMFFILYYINCPNFIVWLPLLFEILDDMCVANVCFPGCDVINFEISLILLFKPLFYMTEKSRQICWNISSAIFSKFDGGNMILFQIKIFATNIKGTLMQIWKSSYVFKFLYKNNTLKVSHY